MVGYLLDVVIWGDVTTNWHCLDHTLGINRDGVHGDAARRLQRHDGGRSPEGAWA